MASDKNRPILITIIAILYFLAGIFVVIGGILMITGTIAVEDVEEDLKGLASAGGAVLVVMGLISIVLAGGFWNGWKIMWYLGVIFTAISLIMGVASLFTGVFVGIITLIIDALIMYYLFRPGVKAFFGV
jgi:hypothetical protein